MECHWVPFLVVSEQNRRGGTGGGGKVMLRGMKERRVLWGWRE